MLSVYEFGKRLLDADDLDPVYVILWNAELEPEILNRWLIAYWCFYHMGTASWIVDPKTEKGFWGRMLVAAGSKDYPRCPERRHFRGQNALRSVDYLASRGVSSLFRDITPDYPIKASSVCSRVREWVGFGPWIAFKVADMLERLNLASVEFSLADAMYDSPLEGAKRLWAQENKYPPPNNVGAWAVERILDRLPQRTAPPGHERPIGFQEIETILCKWKSYLNGKYKIGEDVEGCRKGLELFKDRSPIANLLWENRL